MLNWMVYRCLENSIKDFLSEEIFEDSVTDYNNVLIPIRIGRKESNDWALPCISVYNNSETSPGRLYLGSNVRDRKFLLILDIYAIDAGERLDLAAWLTKKLENGFNYYTYYFDPNNPESVVKTLKGFVDIDAFIENSRVKFSQNVDIVDKNRHRISIQVCISGNCQ